MPEELFDVCHAVDGNPTGVTAPRSVVHAEGLWHRAVHIWLFHPPSGSLLLQRRASCKDSWPDRWDISCAGHLSAGQTAIQAAVRELEEELGLVIPVSRFEWLFCHREELASIQNGRPFINNEYNDVYLITLTDEEFVKYDPATAVVTDTPVTGTTGFVLQVCISCEYCLMSFAVMPGFNAIALLCRHLRSPLSSMCTLMR
jgi:isopentenyldiphosphate isomerase